MPMNWLVLSRWKNLIMIAATQILVWHTVIRPLIRRDGGTWVLDLSGESTLILATLLIAAAGYIINDYFDIKIDLINRPETVILERRIPRKQAIIMHSVFSFLGLGLAILLAHRAGKISLALFQLVCILLLWFYSTHFKRQVLIGNLVVATMVSATVMAHLVFEPLLQDYFREPSILPSGQPNPVGVLILYAGFAFLLTWMREIVKDMEDYKGDAEQGCDTLPIRWGLQKTQWLVQSLGVATCIVLLCGSLVWIRNGWILLGIYVLVALILPLSIWIIRLSRRASAPHYHLASARIKKIMVAGILSLVIYHLEFYGYGFFP